METEAEYGLPSIGIPAELLFNPGLTYMEKILFGFIRNLSKTERGCWASNQYLGELIGVGRQAISNGIANLKKYSYIKIEMVEKDPLTTKEKERRVYEDPDYPSRYRKLVELSHEVYIKHNIGVKEILYTHIKKFILKEDSKKERKTLSLSKDKDSESGIRPHRPSLDVSFSSRPTKSDDMLPVIRLHKNQLVYENASPEARDILNAWNGLPTTSTHRKSSKSVRKVLRLLDGNLLKKHGAEEIRRSMEDFGMMQQNAGLYKVPVARTAIDDFFIGNGFVAGIRKRKGQPVDPPWFQLLILPGSFNNYLRKDDPNQGLMREFKRLYEKHVAGETPEFYTPNQEGQFSKASSLLKRCMERGRLGRCVDGAGIVDYILHFLRALDEEWGASKIRVWHLAAVDSWNSVFPRYITRHWKEAS